MTPEDKETVAKLFKLATDKSQEGDRTLYELCEKIVTQVIVLESRVNHLQDRIDILLEMFVTHYPHARYKDEVN